MAQNQPPLHYPAILNPCPIYQNPVLGAGNHLWFEPDGDSASPTPVNSRTEVTIVTSAVAGRRRKRDAQLDLSPQTAVKARKTHGKIF